MREPPVNLPNETVRACLQARYGLAVVDVTFLPLGHDSSAWVYRVRTAGGAYFLKARLQVASEAGLLVPRYLIDHGVAQVIAPLPTTAGALWADAGGYALILYPFVAGRTGMERGMSARQWIDYGALLRQIHATAIDPDLARVMPRETFTPAWADTVRRLDAQIGADAFDDPAERGLASFWQERREQIRALLETAEELGRRLARATPDLVLCHADIHTANVLLDASGRVWFVDWDETVLAPRERDLMFAIGGISRRLVGPREERLFLQGYGASAVDPLALAYYRYAWAVGDIGAYGAEILFRPDFGPITKRAALDQFLSLFEPGNIVDLAVTSGDGSAQVLP
jgi:spectinomycin phosphotransferase